MSFRSAQTARVYVGLLGAHAYADSVSSAANTDTLDVTTLADTAKQFVAGQNTSTFSISGPLDSDASQNGQYDAITDLQAASYTAPTPITYLPNSTDGGIRLFEALQQGVEISSAVAGRNDWSMTAQTTGITDMRGVVLENNTAVSADGNGTAVDNAALTSNGAAIHLHVTAFSGLTSDVITVEHSVDNVSFATLATFTTVTGLTAERKTTTGTVNRYVRVVDDVTGTGSITRFVAISRR